MLNLIRRNTPYIADAFTLALTKKINGKSYYEVSEQNGKIHIEGDCKISLAMGYYAYLKKYCRVNFAHCGNKDFTVRSAPLPDEKMSKIIDQDKRAYFNYCTFGYSMRSWQWEEWEKEIDFMAMNGINMPLTVVGYEAVMFYTLCDFGFSEKEALAFIAGPSYYPWQMMTNLDTFMHIPDKKFIDKRLELGKKILQRELELGMTPIQQGFAGHIPEKLKEKFSLSSELQYLPTWCGFPGTCQLDPLDKNFTLFGTALLEKQKELFGSYHYYACDPFHENEPPVEGDKYLSDVGRTISKMYTDFDPDSVWVMQGWSLREQIVKAVEKDKLLILDLDGSKNPKMNGFWGYSFICGTLHNFGDRNSLHGSVKLLAENQYSIAKKKYPNCEGTGLFMEGFFQNPLYYDLAFTVITEKEAIDLELWLSDYAERRYGSDEKCLKNAVKLLRDSCYREECTGRETSSIICARPSTTHYHTAPNDHVELRYDNEKLLEAVKELLKSEKADKDGYYFDLCDILRQYMSNSAKEVYFEITDSFKKKDETSFKEKTGRFLEILEQADRLLSTRPELTFDSHIDEAIRNACCEEHKDIFRKNEITLMTIWGPFENNELFDYAWKEWAGLIKHYYMPRWEMFFNELWESFDTDGCHISDTPFNHNERNDYETTAFQKKLRDFEFAFIESYKGSEKSEEKTIDVVRDICHSIH
ncbi:MAG: alpha-N-acetylglucosaminidase [Clostridia bacterium]|nr:alpha-N-acetylglucosaminidase [Clostridia bacterium]